MNKKTLVILFILSVLFSIGAVGVIVGSGALASMAPSTYDAYSGTYTDGGMTTAASIGILFGAGLLLVASVLSLIAWIGALIKQGKQEQWGWFVCTLLFGGIAMLIYLIAVPETPQYAVPTYMPVYQPLQEGYPPQQSYQPYQPYQPYQQQQQQPPPTNPWGY